VTVLVIGGAGYIGSHVVRRLREDGTAVVVVDDLSSGQADRTTGAPLIKLDVAASGATVELADIIADHRATSIIHFAAKKKPAESDANPLLYYRQNVGGLANILDAATKTGLRSIIFSSSAAVYGETATAMVDEDHPTQPVNPYGETKLVGEWMGRSVAAAHRLSFFALRYFNVAGAGWPDLGDPGSANLIPMVFDRLEAGLAPRIFGTDYETPDGTCVRDFVDVLDLAEAHIAALKSAESGTPGFEALNIGTGIGHSVREVIDVACRVANADPTNVEFAPRRPGDPASVVATCGRALERLGWQATQTLEDTVASAWSARRCCP